MANTYTKLRSGDWAVRMDGKFGKGTTHNVAITTRSGETERRGVKVIWTGKDKRTGKPISLATLSGGNKRYSRGHSYSRENAYSETSGFCDECGDRIPHTGRTCWETGGPCYTYGDA